jgi:uncharacterized RDD family membrane protein YckC
MTIEKEHMMFCTQCGAQNPDEAKFCYHCGAALSAPAAMPPVVSEPVAPPPLVSQPSAPSPVIYAGFWRRWLAMVIDSLILSIPSGLLFALFILPTIAAAIAAGDAEMISSIVLSSIFGWIWIAMAILLLRLLYFTIFESSHFQATPGKMALGIIVTDMQGRSVTFPRALGRNVGKILSKMIIWIGFIMAGITQKKQALHDMLADCLVVMR